MIPQSRISTCTSSQHLILVLALALLVPASALAQQSTGKIIGTVTDPHGAVMPGVKIIVTSKATGINYPTTTDKEGYFQVINLPIGDYRVTAEQENFKTLLTDPPSLQINQVLRVDMRMRVGAQNEAITVEGLTAGVETVNATLGHSVTSRPILDLPLNGRNVLDLALLQPGVTEVNPQATDNGQAGTFGIAGGKSDSVTFLLDGGVNNDLLGNEVVFTPNPDTIAEFRVLTSNYSAEYGRNAGGVVSAVTKSGTNAIHGSVYDFLRNDALDANQYFNKQQDLPRSALKRNQFGATLGGPIEIPNLVHGKDKYFWFFSYTGQREIDAIATTQIPVFTPAELQGNFSGDAGVKAFLIANPYFQAQGMPPGFINIDPVAQNYIKAGLVPSAAAGTQITQLGSTDNSDQITAKLDAQFTSRDKLSGTLGWGRHPQLNPFSFTFGSTPSDAYGYGSNENHRTYFSNIAWSHTFSPSLLNEARFTAQRITNLQAFPAKQLPTGPELGIGITPDQATGPTRMVMENGLTLGFSPQGPTTEIGNTFGFSDTISWLKGKHSLKLGGNVSAYQNNTQYDFYVDGEFDFFGSYSGNDFADFLMGLPSSYFQSSHAPSNIRSKAFAGFAQDEWHVRRNLTITYGLRYEYSSPKYDTQGRTFSILPGVQSTRFVNAPPGLVFPGDPGAPTGANFPDKNNFAPRFGFAWDPKGNGKMSVRGGFGVFYDILKGEDNLQFNGQPPFFGYSSFGFPSGQGACGCLPFTSAPNFLSDPYGTSGSTNPFPSTPPSANVDFTPFLPFGGPGLYFVNPHLRTPYTYQFNLSIQRELPQGMTLEVAYVGSVTHGQTALVDANPMVLSSLAIVPGLFDSVTGAPIVSGDRILNLQPGDSTCTPLAGTCSFNYLVTFRNAVNANYNSLESNLTKRITGSHWYSNSYFNLAYTWGKSIDNASGFRNVNSQVPAYDPELFRSVSDYDITHRIAFSGGWDLPIERAWQSGPKLLTKGWSTYPIVTFRTGFPLDISAQCPAVDPAAPGPSGAGDAAIARANVSTLQIPMLNPYNPNTLNYWFDPSVFSQPGGPNCTTSLGALTYGSYPRNYMRGPSRTNFDFALAKKFPIKERANAEFRAEFFNILNHTEFQNPDVNITDPNFGLISSTYPPRIIQFALRFSF